VSGQRLQRAQRGRATHPVVVLAVHELQQLHRELDVAQPAGAQLDLPGGLLRGDGLLDAPPHRLDVVDEPGARAGRPDQRCDQVDEGLAQRGVARYRACLEQRLELPAAGPPPVVALVAGEGAHQRPGPALGAQRGVDREHRGLGARLGAASHHRLGQPGRRAHRRGFVSGSVGLGLGAGDEDDVDVADVVQLLAAALAHADHGETDGCSATRQLLLCEPQRSRQRLLGQLGEPRADGVEAHLRPQVEGAQHCQLAPVGGTQRVQVGRRADVGRLGIDEAPPVLGVADEMVAEGGARSEDGDEAPLENRVVRQRGQQRGPAGCRHALQRPQRQVGVRGAGNSDDPRLAKPSCLHGPSRCLDVDEAQPRQPGGQAAGTPATCARGRRRLEAGTAHSIGR